MAQTPYHISESTYIGTSTILLSIAIGILFGAFLRYPVTGQPAPIPDIVYQHSIELLFVAWVLGLWTIGTIPKVTSHIVIVSEPDSDTSGNEEQTQLTEYPSNTN